MAIGTTTPSAIRTAVVAAIRGMTPTLRPQNVWRYVSEGLMGGEIRTYTVENGASRERLDGFHGGGNIECEFPMTFVVAYGNLSRDELEQLRDADQADLWDHVFHPIPDNGAGGVTGVLVPRRDLEAEIVVDDDGAAVVEYSIVVPYNRAAKAS